mmetsp:Transcript_38957/g.111148  ORF Transcript_38957/g.111148 Transcript_38957/m.111148 type:complete len:317 (-) Transcript_38957:646-1596(-)
MDDFAEPEVCNLHLPAVEEEVAGLEVIVDDLAAVRVHVPEPAQDLEHDAPGLPLRQRAVAPHVLVQGLALAELEYRAEGARGDREAVLQRDHAGVVQRLLDLVLTHGPPDVALALLVTHVLAQLVDLDSAVPVVLEVVRAEDLAEAAAPDHVQKLVPVVGEQRVRPEVRVLRCLQAVYLLEVQRTIDLQPLLPLLHRELFAGQEGHAAAADLAALPEVVGLVAAPGRVLPVFGRASAPGVGPRATLPRELSPQALDAEPVLADPILQPYQFVRLVAALPLAPPRIQQRHLPAEAEVVPRRGDFLTLLGILNSGNLH